jgi:hypothetical protein
MLRSDKFRVTLKKDEIVFTADELNTPALAREAKEGPYHKQHKQQEEQLSAMAARLQPRTEQPAISDSPAPSEQTELEQATEEAEAEEEERSKRGVREGPEAEGEGEALVVEEREVDWDGQIGFLPKRPGRVHECSQCVLPIACYGWLDPCCHLFCLDCASEMLTDNRCKLCGVTINRVKNVDNRGPDSPIEVLLEDTITVTL